MLGFFIAVGFILFLWIREQTILADNKKPNKVADQSSNGSLQVTDEGEYIIENRRLYDSDIAKKWFTREMFEEKLLKGGYSYTDYVKTQLKRWKELQSKIRYDFRSDGADFVQDDFERRDLKEESDKIQRELEQILKSHYKRDIFEWTVKDVYKEVFEPWNYQKYKFKKREENYEEE